MSRCRNPGHRLPVHSCRAVLHRKGQWHQQRLQGLTRSSVCSEGGLLQDKEGKKKVLMERHGCMLFITSFSSLSYLVRHSFARLPVLGGFRLYPDLRTHIKVIYISVIVPSMLFEVVWVLEVTNVHTFGIVSLIGFAHLGQLM